jgi:hypothetical protein
VYVCISVFVHLLSPDSLTELAALESIVRAKALLAVSNWLRLCEPACVQLVDVSFTAVLQFTNCYSKSVINCEAYFSISAYGQLLYSSLEKLPFSAFCGTCFTMKPLPFQRVGSLSLTAEAKPGSDVSDCARCVCYSSEQHINVCNRRSQASLYSPSL